ncbi:MAG: hypothetical protein ACJAXU_001480, partial [Paracoccaceae bacterium]
ARLAPKAAAPHTMLEKPTQLAKIQVATSFWLSKWSHY